MAEDATRRLPGGFGIAMTDGKDAPGELVAALRARSAA
jgi:hypothetical protein